MQDISKYQDLWNKTKFKLQQNLAPNVYEETFSDVKFVAKVENNIVFILVPSIFIKHKINSLYYRSINEIFLNLTENKFNLKFITQDEIEKVKPQQKFGFKNTSLNLNNTFESFVVGSSNRLSYLTALKIAQNPGFEFNPLYIFGGVGLGKTHLMQALGNYVLDDHPDFKVLYVNSQEFLDDYSKASRLQNFDAWSEKYDNIDLFLIDDIQILCNKSGSQQQFFNLFNNLFNNNKQIVITSDKPATELNQFMERLTSRFQSGVTVNINNPSREERIKILERKAKEKTNKIIPTNVLEYIADNIDTNVRELEGALNRIINSSDLLNEEINVNLAEEILQPTIKSKSNSNKNYEDLLSIIADMYNISTMDLIGKSREGKIVTPRHISMYILYTHYNLPYKTIGAILGNRDHTTIMNGCEKIEKELKINEELKMVIETLLKKV